MFETMAAALEYIFRTRRRLDSATRGLDEHSRDPASTRQLLERAGLLAARREYVVVTGSRGKGSVCAILAKLLGAHGMRVGMVSSPHLVHWNERIRVGGRMIATGDFLRILGELKPDIDAVSAALPRGGYLSPQGIFLALALRYFDAYGVEIAVVEVGRGGRFDDIAVVPNRLALFAPIMLEHRALLGDSLQRIAWHKAGIIKRAGSAISLPQAPVVTRALQAEADAQQAQLCLLRAGKMAQWLADSERGQDIHMPGYGRMNLPLLGRYQVDNASLALAAAEWLCRARGLPPQRRAMRSGLAQVRWLGRVQEMQSSPAIYIDGAITVPSARSFVASLRPRLTEPTIGIAGIPRDRDFAGVYRELAEVCSSIILTETDINPSTVFPAREQALQAARAYVQDARHALDLPRALELATQELAGKGGTILLAGSLMLIGECMLLWGVDTSVI